MCLHKNRSGAVPNTMNHQTSQSHVHIRPATPADAAAISVLIQTLAQQFIIADFSAAGQQHFLQAHCDHAISQLMANGLCYWLAEDGDALLGCIGMRHYQHLYHLFVRQDQQGRGLARQLWQLAQQVCTQHGNKGTYTVNASLNAVPVYQAFGFQINQPALESQGVRYQPMQLLCEPSLSRLPAQ